MLNLLNRMSIGCLYQCFLSKCFGICPTPFIHSQTGISELQWEEHSNQWSDLPEEKFRLIKTDTLPGVTVNLSDCGATILFAISQNKIQFNTLVKFNYSCWTLKIITSFCLGFIFYLFNLQSKDMCLQLIKQIHKREKQTENHISKNIIWLSDASSYECSCKLT